MAVNPKDWLDVELDGGRYRITNKLGEGGMGYVYQAHARNLDCPVVIKVPRQAMLDEPHFAGRFEREIRSLVNLAHPHIVQIIDVGQHEGVPFAVMQYLSGGSLEDRQVDNTPVKLSDWLPAVSAALDFVHRRGYVHRDVKPGNILFDEEGHAFLSDFGVAKVFVDSDGSTMAGGLTGTGMVLGTPGYMAPEVVMDQPYDGRSDQYSLGVTVYELLSGRQPFVASAPAAVMVEKVTKPAPALSAIAPHLAPPICESVDRALLKDPHRRFESCAAFPEAALVTIAQTASAERRDVTRPGVTPSADAHLQQQPSIVAERPITKPLPTRWPISNVSVSVIEPVTPRDRRTIVATTGESRRKIRWSAAVGGLALLSLLLAVTLFLVLGLNDSQNNDPTIPEVSQQTKDGDSGAASDVSNNANAPSPAIPSAQHPPPPAILLVHGMSLDLDRPNDTWGIYQQQGNGTNSWSGMIGALNESGFSFGGVIRPQAGELELPNCLDTTGVVGDPKRARVFSLALSKSAATDELTLKALELADCLKAIRQYTGCEKVIIVAHSAGGVVARVYLQDALPGIRYAKDVDRLITIGSPHLGSTLAEHFGDFLGTRATSLKPDAELIVRLNSTLALPTDVRYASIVVRGFQKGLLGDWSQFNDLIDEERLSRLPVDFYRGGDEVVHVCSQNLAISESAIRYEALTNRPILFPLARVTNSKSLNPVIKVPVHLTAPQDASVARIVIGLIDDNSDAWEVVPDEELPEKFESSAVLYAMGIVEFETLSWRQFSEVMEVVIDDFQLNDVDHRRLQYQFRGTAKSRPLRVSLMRSETIVSGIMHCQVDKFGRIVECSWEVIDNDEPR